MLASRSSARIWESSIVRHPNRARTSGRIGRLTLLDRIETVLHNLRSMPKDIGRTNDKELVALASKRVPLLVPNAFRNPDNVAFALKLSLCVTICYVFYHAVDWTGISTCVTTVIITALSTRGAINQKLAQRVLGSIIGGLILAIGATAFLFPHMDSITSLIVLVAAVSFALSLVRNRTAVLLCGPTNRARFLSGGVQRLRPFDRISSCAGSLRRNTGGPDCHVDSLR